MPELIKTSASILETIRWHESSKIVTLYTREEGILKVIARGALRPKSPFAGRLETLNLIQAIISQKESRELQILTQAEILEPFGALKTDLSRLPYGLAMAELLKKVLEKGHHDEIFFDFLIKMLRALTRGKQPQHIFEYFLLKFVSFLGFKPDFKRCFSCGRDEFPQGAWLVFKEGALLCPDCKANVELSIHLEPATIQFLRTLQAFNHRKISEFEYPTSQSLELIPLLMRYLNFHLGHEISLNALNLLPDPKSAP